jgi:hypothetical protein
LVAADVQSGVMISADGGRTWTPLGTEPVAWVSSGDGLRTIYASGGAAPQRSRDGGTTWEAVNVPVGATLLEMGSDGTLYAGVHDGSAVAVWFSGDDGVTWSRPWPTSFGLSVFPAFGWWRRQPVDPWWSNNPRMW